MMPAKHASGKKESGVKLLIEAAKEAVAAIAGARGAIGDVGHLVNTQELLEKAIARTKGLR